MAIIDGIQSSVIVNRQVAQEYRPPATDQNAANAPTESTVYIEDKDQAEFYFKVELPRNFKWEKSTILAVEVYLNGREGECTIIRKRNPKKGGTWQCVIDGIHKKSNSGDEFKHHKWIFENIQLRPTRPEENIPALEAKFRKLGLLTVRIRHARLARRNNGPYVNPARCPNMGEVPDEALEDQSIYLSTGITFLKSDKKPGERSYITFPQEEPIAVFNYLYRSRRALKDMGIIENTPDRVPLSKRNPDNMDKEELIELVKMYKGNEALQERRRVLKREKFDQEHQDGHNLSNTRDLDPESDSDDCQIIDPPPKKKPKIISID